MANKIIAVAALFGMTAIILGAFGAHSLKETLSPENLEAFKTGVTYQMYYALLLLFIGISPNISEKSKNAIFYLTTLGTLLFSGSIYILSTRALTGFDIRTFGILTPIGGLLLIIAWLRLFIDFMKKKS